MTDLSELSEGEKWVLRLLHAPQKEGSRTSIEGRTRLVKGLFLVEKMFSEKFSDFTGTGFEFRAYKYGPFDESVYEALDRLEEKSLVEEKPTREYEGDEIRLPLAGERVAERAYNELRPEYQSHLLVDQGKTRSEARRTASELRLQPVPRYGGEVSIHFLNSHGRGSGGDGWGSYVLWICWSLDLAGYAEPLEQLWG